MWNTPARPWNDFSADSAWLGTCWDNQGQWLHAHGGVGKVHPLFSLMGVTIFTVMADSLHIMELGVVQRVVGNTISHMVFETGYLDGATASDRLSSLWGLIVDGCHRKHSPSQLGNLAMNLFCIKVSPHSHQPCLSSTGKAAESRYLLLAIAEIFEPLAHASDTDKLIVEVLNSLTTYYNCVECKDHTLPRLTQRRLDSSVWTAARCCNALQSWALRCGFRRWGIRIKQHMSMHIALQSRYCNPRKSWTYMDEDFMHLLKVVGESCTKGTATQRIVARACERYALGYDIRSAWQ